jgi:hypothetical protein
MKKIFTLAFLILTLSLYTSSVNAQCSYTLDLFDSFGDGWNGNTIDVDTNGVAYGNFTIATGSFNSIMLNGLTSGMNLTITWNATGGFPNECSWELIGAGGETVHLETATPTTAGLSYIANCPPCSPPSTLAATAVTGVSASLSWVPGATVFYDMEIGLTGFIPGSGTSFYSTTGINTTEPVTGLMPATAYDFYVQGICPNGDTVLFMGPYTFSTTFSVPDGVACVTGGSSILFSEDFEGTQHATPIGWTGAFGGNAQWDITVPNANSSSTGPNIATSGTQHMEFEGSGSGTAFAVTPPINLTTANDEVELSFYMHAFGGDMGTLNINVGTSPTGPFTSVFIYMGDYQTTATQAWEHISVDLTAYLGQIIYVQFENTNTTTWEADMSIDLIEVRSCVTCPAPTALSVSNVTTTTADLAWTTGGAAVWLVEYGPTGFTPGMGDSTILSVAASLTVTGLNAATSYDFYVSDLCLVGDTSIGVSVLNIATDFLTPDGVLCTTGATSVLYAEDFESTAVSGTPSGWIGSFGTSAAWEVTPSNANSFGTGPNVSISGTQHLEFQAGTNSSAAVVSPAINLTTSNDEVEMSFYMHAFGTGMGTFDINISNSQTGPFTPIFTYSGQLQTSATQAWEHIAVDLTAYIGQIVYVQFTNVSLDFRGDVAFDLFEVRSCLTCPAPTDVLTSGVTENSADVAWTTGGAFAWVLEYGPAGFTPGNGDTTITVGTNPYTLTGLDASTVYDVYVSDLCGLGDSSFAAGPGRFATDCDTVIAPYYQSFDFALADPHCWSSAGADPWLYRSSNTVGGFPAPNGGVANSVDHTSGAGNYAWIDASGNINTNELISPVIDYSGLTQGIVGAWIKSNNTSTSNNALNLIQIEGFNGVTWDSIINYSGNFDGWRRVYANIPASLPNITTFRIVQINDPAGISTFNNDILVDDFFVEEAPTCFNPTLLMDSIISPTLVELSWTTGGATDWIIEYGPNGFLPGTGVGTLINTNQNPYVLPVNSGQDYEWYVQDSCGPTDISWYSYVNDFRMPGEVICDSVSTNFTYCHPDESVELFTYQSDNSTSFLHLVFNAGILGNFVDFTIYDGPNDTYPVLFSSTGGTNMAAMEFVTSGPFVAFSYNSVFANVCNTPFDFDINCCETTTFEQVVNLCVDSTYTLPDGVVVGSEAAYYSTIPNFKGCDSVITTVINILQDSTTAVDIICAGSSYLLPDGITTFAPGNYQMVVSNYLGCDSAIDLTLTLVQPSSSTRNVSVCAGDSYEMPNGTFVSTAGVHNLIYGNEGGCDSTYSVTLTLNALTTSTATPVVLCQGTPHTLVDGVVVTTAGTYTSITTNFDGCDETVTTLVTMANSTSFQDTVDICDQDTYTLINGDVINEAGEYNVNISNAAGCDSTVTIFVSKCIASGITGEENNAVASIFPNPSSSLVNVTFNTEVINSNIDLRVMNALGQEVETIENISETSIVINVSTYSNGMYYLVVNDETNTSIKKFVVSK